MRSTIYGLLLLVILLVFGCKPPMVSYKTVPPQIPIQDTTKAILLIDAGNVYTPGLIITKKREKVVTELSKNYLQLLQQQIGQQLPIKAVSDTTIAADIILQLQNHNDTVAARLLQKYAAGIVVVLQTYDAGFVQDEVVKTTNSSGSTDKIAYYSVFFKTTATIYQDNQWYNKIVTISKPHSQRSVVSGLLARGPGYEANKKDIADVMALNTGKLCELFMPTTETVYTKQ